MDDRPTRRIVVASKLTPDEHDDLLRYCRLRNLNKNQGIKDLIRLGRVVSRFWDEAA